MSKFKKTNEELNKTANQDDDLQEQWQKISSSRISTRVEFVSVSVLRLQTVFATWWTKV